MWQYIIPAIAVIGAAVLTQTEFFDPTSRNVRRLKAYLEVKQQLKDTQHESDIDSLIAHVIGTELRVRTTRRWFKQARKLEVIWIGAAIALIGVAVFIAIRTRGGEALPAMTALAASVIGIVFSFWTARQYGEQVAAEKNEMREASLTGQYAKAMHSKGLAPDAALGDRLFDLVLRDESGKTAELVDVKSSVNSNLRMILRKKMMAQDFSQSARYVLLLEQAPTNVSLQQLRRMGVTVAYPIKGGAFHKDGDKPNPDK